MTTPLVKIRHLHKTFLHMGRKLHVLKGIDLDIGAAEVVAIVGKSGAGKSTLLHCMGTLDLPTSGTIMLAGKELTGLGGAKLAAIRNETIGFVFQFHHLLPEFNALENVMMPGIIQGRGRAGLISRAKHLLAEVGLADRESHRPGELSGGEQQRVALARALVLEPKLILADEPTGNLDSGTSDAIHDLFFDINKKHGTTIVVVTHNIAFAQSMPRVVTMLDGRIERDERTSQRSLELTAPSDSEGGAESPSAPLDGDGASPLVDEPATQPAASASPATERAVDEEAAAVSSPSPDAERGAAKPLADGAESAVAPPAKEPPSIRWPWMRLIIAAAMLVGGGQGVYTALTNRTPTKVSCAEYAAKRPAAKWLTLSNCAVDPAVADKVKKLYLPLLATEAREGDDAAVVLVTQDSQLSRLRKGPPGANGLMPLNEITGLVKFGIELKERERAEVKRLAERAEPDFVLLDEGEQPRMTMDLGMFAAGLMIALHLLWSFLRRRRAA